MEAGGQLEGSWLDEKLGYPRSWIRAFERTGREEQKFRIYLNGGTVREDWINVGSEGYTDL